MKPLKRQPITVRPEDCEDQLLFQILFSFHADSFCTNPKGTIKYSMNI